MPYTSKTDEFSEKFQTAFDPPLIFGKSYCKFFSKFMTEVSSISRVSGWVRGGVQSLFGQCNEYMNVNGSSLKAQMCLFLLYTKVKSSPFHCCLPTKLWAKRIILAASSSTTFSSWLPRRGIWLSSRLEEMESHVVSENVEKKMYKYVAAVKRRDGRFSTFYGFNETIGGSEANY